MNRYMLLLLGMAASPVAAQTFEGAWKGSKDRIEAPPVHVSFPRSVGGLTLTKTSEFSRKGEGVDNSAEYRSADGKIWATIYAYLPGYADAALAAHMTDRTIHLVYGSGVTLVSQMAVPIGGRPNSAIRTIYTGGVMRDSGVLASGAAYAHVGGWILKLRVSGPVERREEVEAALDAVLASAQFDKKAHVFESAPLNLAAPCPAAASGSVAMVKSKESGANLLMAALGAAVASAPPRKGNDAIPPAFPANGLMKACLRGTVPSGKETLEVLQPVADGAPDIILVQLNDTGDLVTVQKNLIGAGYTLGKSEIARTTVFGEIDRMPDNEQLAKIMAGEQTDLVKVRSTTTIHANGNTDIAMSPEAMK